MKRNIFRFDEYKCTGCSLCTLSCPEGAIQVLDGKARLVSDIYCDGLGACIGACPEGAISIIEREAGDYDERAVMKNIACQGESVIAAHLNHLVTNDLIIVYHRAIEFLHDHHIAVPEHQSIESTLRSV